MAFIVVLAVLIAVAAIVTGVALYKHKVPTYTSDGYVDDCTAHHPYRADAAVVLVGGLLQAIFVASFAALHAELRSVRVQVALLVARAQTNT